MAVKRVGPKDIINMNELYLVYKTKAEVARQTSFSASTVSKYIIQGYKTQLNNIKYEILEEKSVDTSIFLIPIWDDFITMSYTECIDMEFNRDEASF